MKKAFLFISALLAIASCAKEVAGDAIQQSNTQEKVFTCSLENDATKVYVDDQSRLYWNEGDLVSIFTRGLNEKYMFAGKDGDIGGTFSFVGQRTFGTGSPMSANYAVYPYYEGTTADYEGNISVVIPATQQYKHGSFGPGANLMVAVTEDADDFFLPFKNTCGYLSIKLFGHNVCVKTITFKGNNDEPLTGKAYIKASHTELPELTIAADGGKEIVLDCGSGVTIGKNKDDAATFWIVVPPMTFTNGFTFTIEAVNGEIFEKSSTKEQIIKRNICKDMSPVNINSAYAATNVTEVTLDQDVIYFKEAGEKIQLHATVYPEDATNKNVFWTSFDESIATVDQDGTVTAVGEGEVTIEVTTEDGEHTAEAKAHIDWQVPTVESFEISSTSIDVTDGAKTLTFTIKVLDATGVSSTSLHVFNTDNTNGNHSFDPEVNLISGDDKNGIYEAVLVLDGETTPGHYQCDFGAIDVLGNQAFDGVIARQHFTVSNEAMDFGCPTVESFEISSASIDVTDGAKTLTFTIKVLDATGVSSTSLHVFNTDNTNGNHSFDPEVNLISGDDKNGIYEAVLVLDGETTPGHYQCDFGAIDVLGNQAFGGVIARQHFTVINNL